MKKIVYSLSLKARIALCIVALALTGGMVPAFAQDDGLGSQILQNAEQSIRSTTEGFFSILKIILIIGAAISLVMVGFNVIQGERDSMKKAGWWIIGLVFCLGGLGVLVAFVK